MREDITCISNDEYFKLRKVFEELRKKDMICFYNPGSMYDFEFYTTNKAIKACGVLNKSLRSQLAATKLEANDLFEEISKLKYELENVKTMSVKQFKKWKNE